MELAIETEGLVDARHPAAAGRRLGPVLGYGSER